MDMKYILKCSRGARKEEEIKLIKELKNHFVFERKNGDKIKTLKQCRVLNEDYLELVSTEKTLLFRMESYSVVCVEEN
jgi:hypothetical protein